MFYELGNIDNIKPLNIVVGNRGCGKLEYFSNLKQSLERQCENAQWKDLELNAFYDSVDDTLRQLEKEVHNVLVRPEPNPNA